MNYRAVSIIVAALTLGLTFNLFAQVVNIPDPALDRLIRQKLRIRSDRTITQDDMRKLRGDFDAGGNIGITDITGLEYATNLTALSFYHNPISDISPMSGMTSLRGFNLWGCQIEDLTPLRHLPNLEGGILGANRISNLEPLSGMIQMRHIELEDNRISDIGPLASLINLERLELDHNRIADFSPLANLTRLDKLWIRDNFTTDITPLLGLTLSEFWYDEICDISPPFSLEERLKNRSYPSIFRAWDIVVGQDHLAPLERDALHDLWFSPHWEINWNRTLTEPLVELATQLTVAGDNVSYDLRQRIHQYNPDAIAIRSMEIHARGSTDAFPLDSPMWLRDAAGNIVREELSGAPLTNFLLPEVQELLVNRIVAIERCGLYDGVFLDGFNRHGTGFVGRHLYEATDEEIIQAYINIFEAVRAKTRDDFLILINANQSKPTRFAEYVNGIFMESGKDYPGGYTRDWILVHEDVLTWAENNLKEPRINCLYGQGMSIEPPDGPNNLRWMRMFTTLSLTHSDGYVMYTTGEGDIAPFLGLGFHHRHLWHDFWNTDLGQPIGGKAQRYNDIDGLFIREFTNGWAVYNRSGIAQLLEFDDKVQSVTSGLNMTNHAVLDLDGDIFLKSKGTPEDVNNDGSVNILDLVFIANNMDTDNKDADVNGDGHVNILDLVVVARKL